MTEQTMAPVEKKANIADDTAKINKITSFYGLNEQVKAMKTFKEDLSKTTDGILESDDLAVLEAKVAELTMEEIKAMTDDQIEALYVTEDGVMTLSDNKTTEDRELQFKRDFIVHIKEQAETEQKIDEQIFQLEEEISKFEPEFNEILKEFDDIGLYLRNKLEDELNDESTTQERKDRLVVMIAAYDDVYTMDRIHKNLVSRNLSNVIHDYKHRDTIVYKKYMNTIKKLQLQVDLTMFNGLEEKFLEEKYNKYPNLFLFIVIKHYAYLKSPDKAVDGMFMSQLSLVMKNLFNGKLEESKKEQLLGSIRRTLDLFI